MQQVDKNEATNNLIRLNNAVNQSSALLVMNIINTTPISSSSSTINTKQISNINDQTIKFLVEFSAGAVGGAVSRTA